MTLHYRTQKLNKSYPHFLSHTIQLSFKAHINILIVYLSLLNNLPYVLISKPYV